MARVSKQDMKVLRDYRHGMRFFYRVGHPEPSFAPMSAKQISDLKAIAKRTPGVLFKVNRILMQSTVARLTDALLDGTFRTTQREFCERYGIKVNKGYP